MHLDAAKATQDAGEADFLRLVCLCLLFSCFFHSRNHPVAWVGFYVISYFHFLKFFFNITEFCNCCLVIFVFSKKTADLDLKTCFFSF